MSTFLCPGLTGNSNNKCNPLKLKCGACILFLRHRSTQLYKTENYWSRHMYMRGRELSTLVVILFVILSSQEFTLRSSNLNIACSAATSLSSQMEKVIFYRTFVSREPSKVQKVKKVKKMQVSHENFYIVCQKIDKGLEDFHKTSLKIIMCRFPSFLLLIELQPQAQEPGGPKILLVMTLAPRLCILFYIMNQYIIYILIYY